MTKSVVSDANLSRCAEFVVHLLDKTIARYSFQLALVKQTIDLSGSYVVLIRKLISVGSRMLFIALAIMFFPAMEIASVS